MMNEITIYDVSMRNFLSYGNNTTNVPLNRGQSTTLIKGEVIDESSINGGSNGSGKTAILNALCFAYYDTAISDMSKDEMVNDVNNKNMEVLSTFSVGDGFKYRVERRRKMKAGASGNSAALFQIDKDNNEVDITPHSVALLNEKIQQLLGIPFELFVRIIVFSATNVPFLNLSGPAQKAILEELFQQTILTKKADVLKTMIKDSESTIKTLQLKIDQTVQEQARHNKLIDSTKIRIEQWEENRVEEMSSITAKLKQLLKVNVEEQLSFHKQLDEVNANLKVSQRDLRDMSQLALDAKNEINKINIEQQQLKDSLCPYCKQEFLDSQAKIAENNVKLIDLQQKFSGYTTSEKILIVERDALLESSASLKSKITSDASELTNHQKLVDQLQNKLVDLSESSNPYNESLVDLQAMKIEDIDYSDINKATNILEHQKFLLKLLTKKDSFVRKAILQKHLPMLNGRLQHYVKSLGLPFVVKFTQEMTASITKFDRSRSFGMLSNGQRARVNIALSFAFRDVLQAIHKRINICVLDEVLDVGLCPVGVIAAAKLLKQVAKEDDLSVYIISHRDELQDMFDNVLKVQFKEGFSNII